MAEPLSRAPRLMATTTEPRAASREPHPATRAATRAPAGRRPAWVTGALGPLLFAALAYVPLLLTDPGKVDADTKSYLYLDPGRVVRNAASMWDPHIGLGTVTHQNIGYLFPMGPFYWLLEQALGLPAWVAQRLWLGTLVFAAGMGVRYLLRVLDVRGPGVPAAMLLYALTPYVLEFSARLSVLLGPWAALPWMLAFVALALRRGGWKYPALFAVTVQLVGGVNATALIYAGIGPVLWVPYAVWISREVKWRAALATVGRIALLTLLTSLWWIAGLWAQSGYGLDILRFTESVETVSATSYANEVLRGLGYWFFYGRDKIGLWNPAMADFTQKPWLIFVSYLLPTLALLSAAVLRWRHRAYFVLLALVGVVIAVAASPYDDPSVLGSIFKSFATTSTAGLALRSTARAVPLMALGFAVLAGAAITAAGTRLTRAGFRWAGWGIAAVVAALAIANAPGVWNGRYYSKYLERPEEIPTYWQQALHYVDRAPHDTRVLALPGADFAAYRWGDTVDPIEPGLIDRPYVARELVPWGSAPSANLLQALDHRLQEGDLDPNAIAAVARLMGVGDVLLRMDLQTDRFDLVPAEELWRQFSPDAPAGLDPAKTFGTTIPGRLRYPDLGDLTRPLRTGETAPPPVAVLGVQDPLPIVRAKPTSAPLVVDGDGEGLVDASTAGLLDASRLVLYSGSYLDDPTLLRQRAGDATLVVTDSNRRRAVRWSSLRDNFGYTEQAGETPMREDVLDQRLDVFPDAPDDARTVTEYRGVQSVQATSYGNPFFGYTPDARPALALDGNPDTAWQVAGGLAKVPAERFRIVLRAPITTDHVDLTQITQGVRGRWITGITLTFDGKDALHRTLGRQSRTSDGESVKFPARTFTSLEIRIDRTQSNRVQSKVSAAGRARHSAVGFSEIGLRDSAPGAQPVRAEETVRLPRDLLTTMGAASQSHPLVLLMSRTENELHRTFTLPTTRTFTFAGTGRIIPGADGDAVDAILGLPGTSAGAPTATARNYLGGARSRATSAIDGDPTTAWNTPYDKVAGKSVRVDLPAATTIDHLNLQVVADGRHSVPTRVEIAADDGQSRTVELPEVGDGTARSAVATVPVSFPALTGHSFTVTIRAIRPVRVLDPVSELRISLPAAIAELGIPGVQAPALSPTLPASCRSDLVTLDGRPFPIRISGTTQDALDNKSFAVEPCGGAVTLAAGTHHLDTTMNRRTGVAFDRMVLSSAAGGGPASVADVASTEAGSRPRTTAPSVKVTKQSDTAMTVSVRDATAPFWLVMGQSHNKGWSASAAGHDLGTPQLVDGYANGWLVRPNGNGTMTVTLRWTPQRTVNVALALSAVGGVLCLGILAFGLRRRRAVRVAGQADVTSSLRLPQLASPLVAYGRAPGRATVTLTTIGSAAAAGFLVRPWTGVLVGAFVFLVLVRPRWRWLLSIAPFVLLGLGGAYVAVSQYRHHYAPQFNWVTFFRGMRYVGWLAIVLLAADAVVGLVRHAEPDATDAPPSAPPPSPSPPAAAPAGAAAAHGRTAHGPARAPSSTVAPMSRRAWLLSMLGLAAVAVAVPLLVASHYGALGVPRSDDWSYLVTLFRWVDHGNLALNDWVSMTLVGQLALSAPVLAVTGRSVTAMEVWTAVAGFVGLVAVVALGRRLFRPAWWAVLLAFTLALGPLWGPLASTYMTDIPAFALEVVALLLGCIALGRRPVSLPWFGAALAVGFVGISVRQYGAIPVVALVLAAVWTLAAERDWRRLRAIALMTGAVLLATIALLLWWSSLPDSKSLVPTSASGYTIRRTLLDTVGFVRLTGLLLLPVVVLARPLRIVRRAWDRAPTLTVVVGGVAALVLAATYAIDSHTPFVGNYVARQGVLADDVVTGRRPNVMPSLAFDALVVIGSLGAIVLVLAMVPAAIERWQRLRARRFEPEDPRVAALGFTVLGFSAAYAVAIFTGLPIFDRYALPGIPVAGLLLLTSVSRRDVGGEEPVSSRSPQPAPPTRARPRAVHLGGVVVAVAVLAITGLVYSADSASFDATRWKVASLATERGYSPLQIDGGFEWISWHRGRGPLTAPTVAERRKLRRQYFSGLCVTVVIDPPAPPADRVVARARSSSPARDPVWVYALRNTRSCDTHGLKVEAP